MNAVDRATTTLSPTLHISELPDGPPNSPIAQEWEVYCNEVGRLLAEGHEGDWLLIKGDSIVGIWNAEEEANAVRLEQYPNQPVLMKQIREWEPIVRGGGYHRQWLS